MSISNVFVPKSDSSARVFDILNIVGCSEVKGDVGIEIEVEGNKFPKGGSEGHLIPEWWTYHNDGSLRGHDNAEYVLRRPIKFEDVPTAVNSLWQTLDDYGSVLDDSNRTSVHVHLNVQKWHLNRLCSFFAMYFSIEEILTAWCGDHRVGNLFCLRAKDAPGIISKIKRFIRDDGRTSALSDGLHYSGMNAQAMIKFGSVEIRTLRGVTTPDLVIEWVNILRRIYEISADFTDPRTVCANFSGNGPLDYLQMLLGEHVNMVREGSGMDTQQIMESLYEGIRMAQDLAYCRDWDEFKAMEIKPDPFGRSSKKIAKKIVDNSWLLDMDVSAVGALPPLTPINFVSPAPIPEWVTHSLNMPVESHPLLTETDWFMDEDYLEEI